MYPTRKREDPFSAYRGAVIASRKGFRLVLAVLRGLLARTGTPTEGYGNYYGRYGDCSQFLASVQLYLQTTRLKRKVLVEKAFRVFLA